MSLIPSIYRPPLGLPLYWADEQSGRLRDAVQAYLGYLIDGSPEPTPDQLSLLWDYVCHHIHAPAWDCACVEAVEQRELADLRRQAGQRGDVAAVRAYLRAAEASAMDPF
jgi:hypothetical protein